jgi:hypothetical protein
LALSINLFYNKIFVVIPCCVCPGPDPGPA